MPEAHITATDLNPAMVSWAADRISGAIWMQADGRRLDWQDASLDLNSGDRSRVRRRR
jgi:ubiquinone/menaquinone biosynthesis C-methylase UbiE